MVGLGEAEEPHEGSGHPHDDCRCSLGSENESWSINLI